MAANGGTQISTGIIPYSKMNVFSKIFSTPDLEHTAQKRSAALRLGFAAGGAAGVSSLLLMPNLTFVHLFVYKKRYACMQMTKAFLVGGVSAWSYMGAVQFMCKYREKDDWVNHFVGGYVGILPYCTLLKPDWRFFLLGGLFWGSMCALAKMAGQSDTVLPAFKRRRERLGQTKYPEIFLYQQSRRDVDRARHPEKYC